MVNDRPVVSVVHACSGALTRTARTTRHPAMHTAMLGRAVT